MKRKKRGEVEWHFPTVPKAFFRNDVSRAPKPSGLSSRIKPKGEDYQETTREGSYIVLQRC